MRIASLFKLLLLLSLGLFILDCTPQDDNPPEDNSIVELEEMENEVPVKGCTDSDASNYNPDSTEDDGSCSYDIVGCTNPNFINYDLNANVEGDCNSIEFIGNLNLVGQPYYVLGINNGVIITGGENSTTSLKFDLNTGDLDIFPSTVFNTEFRRHPNDTQIKKLSIAANENREDEIIRFDFKGVRVYSIIDKSENLETFNFDVTQLIPINPGHEYRAVARVYEAFKVNGYLYLFFGHSYNNPNNNTVYYREFVIRGNQYGAGDWEYIGEYSLPGNVLINETAVTNQGDVLLITDNVMYSYDFNTFNFNIINLDPPIEFSQNNGITESFKGLLCGEFNFNGDKEFVHYAYASIDDHSNIFKVWYYNNSLNSWFETNEFLDFGGNKPRMRATSILRNDDGANTLFNVNPEGDMFIFSPN